MNTNDEKKYRMLNEGEIIKENDEVSLWDFNGWRKITSTKGNPVFRQDVGHFRRPIENEENVS